MKLENGLVEDTEGYEELLIGGQTGEYWEHEEDIGGADEVRLGQFSWGSKESPAGVLSVE